MAAKQVRPSVLHSASMFAALAVLIGPWFDPVHAVGHAHSNAPCHHSGGHESADHVDSGRALASVEQRYGGVQAACPLCRHLAPTLKWTVTAASPGPPSFAFRQLGHLSNPPHTAGPGLIMSSRAPPAPSA